MRVRQHCRNPDEHVTFRRAPPHLASDERERRILLLLSPCLPSRRKQEMMYGNTKGPRAQKKRDPNVVIQVIVHWRPHGGRDNLKLIPASVPFWRKGDHAGLRNGSDRVLTYPRPCFRSPDVGGYSTSLPDIFKASLPNREHTYLDYVGLCWGMGALICAPCLSPQCLASN